MEANNNQVIKKQCVIKGRAEKPSDMAGKKKKRWEDIAELDKNRST